MKRKLVKCAPRAYSKLIRSDIPGSSGARPARLPFLRSSPLYVMKRPVPKSSLPFISEPLIAKPTQGKLRSRLEVLAKKKRSVKRKSSSSPEGCPPSRGKTLQCSVWSPTSRGAAPPPTMPDEAMGNRDRPEAARDEDSLLSHVELTVGAVSSILHDSDLRRVGALPVEEALALLLQGTSSVRPSAFVDILHYCFSLVI